MKNSVLRAFMILFVFSFYTLPLCSASIDLKATKEFYVADYADVISEETEKYIITCNDELYYKTGAQVVVAAVDFLGGVVIERYANMLFNNWGIGSKEKNNGVLLLLAVGDDKYWAVQGRGLEQTLSSGILGDILYENLEDDFDRGDYDSGVKKSFTAILTELENIYGITITAKENSFSDEKYDDDYIHKQDTDGEIYESYLPFLPSFFGLIISGIFMLFRSFGFVIIVVIIIFIITRGGGSGGSRRRTSRHYIPPVIFTNRRGSRSGGFGGSSRSPSSRGGSFGGSSRGGSFGGGSRGGGGGSSRGGGAGRR